MNFTDPAISSRDGDQEDHSSIYQAMRVIQVWLSYFLTQPGRSAWREVSLIFIVAIGESTASSVRDIPMPEGTPPPLHNQKPPAESQKGPRQPHELPPKPVVPVVQTTYESAPILRDLRKEAAAFVPAAVKRKIEARKAREERAAEDAIAEGRVNQNGDGDMTTAEALTKRINAAPDVDDEFTRFQAEMEEIKDEDT